MKGAVVILAGMLQTEPAIVMFKRTCVCVDHSNCIASKSQYVSRWCGWGGETHKASEQAVNQTS